MHSLSLSLSAHVRHLDPSDHPEKNCQNKFDSVDVLMCSAFNTFRELSCNSASLCSNELYAVLSTDLKFGKIRAVELWYGTSSWYL